MNFKQQIIFFVSIMFFASCTVQMQFDVGKDGKEFRRSYNEGRQAEAALDVGDWDNVHYELHQALRVSIRYAIDSLDEEMKNEINNQQYAADLKATAARRGDVEQLRQLQKYNNY